MKKALVIIDMQIMPFIWKNYGGKDEGSHWGIKLCCFYLALRLIVLSGSISAIL
jgi:hypothetical protein